MTVVRHDELPAIGPAAITLGVFDGVHRGHRQILDVTRRAARDRDAASVAIVFRPHPDEVVRPGTVVPRLLPPEVTLDRIRATGIDHAVEVAFDEEVRGLEPEAFLAGLRSGIELRAVVMTPESAFGRRRAGTLERVREIGLAQGFDAVAVQLADAGGSPVSSSRIRKLLAAGDLPAAVELMVEPPVLRGTVVHGDARGRELGFPTANLAFTYEPALPALGIYLGRVTVPDRHVAIGHPGLVSIGVRPTFEDSGRVLVEVYLLDWDGDLYDAQLSVELGVRLRDERRFHSVDALVQQMRADEAAARRILGRADGG